MRRIREAFGGGGRGGLSTELVLIEPGPIEAV
jgi:hypothetical protein